MHAPPAPRTQIVREPVRDARNIAPDRRYEHTAARASHPPSGQSVRGMTGVVKSPSLPDHPILAAWASALNETGYWAQILDANWRYVFVTDELSVTRQALGLPAIPIGAHLLSAEGVHARNSVGLGLRQRFVEPGS